MPERTLTEGARRAIELAERLAREDSRPVAAGHLLWALLSEESAAFERLERHGFTIENVDRKSCFSAEAATENSADDWDELLYHADTHARREGRGVEVSTEHLLMALLIVNSPVRAVLAKGGLRDEGTPQVATEKYADPIAADFEIKWTDATENDRTRTLRILDAAANRAREGFRVVEDYVRFTLDDAFLSRQLKELRHQLSSALGSFNDISLVRSRDTQADVGTTIRTSTEMQRASLLDVAKANLKRIEEAVRTLEEFSKVATGFDRSSEALQTLPEQLGQIRYRLYTIEKAILTAHDSRRRLEDANLYLLLSKSLCRHDWQKVLRDAITGGVRVVQIREKEMSDRELLEHARRVRAITSEFGTLLIMNDRPDLAVLCEADGVHVGQEELPVSDARRIVGPDKLVGVSTHSIEQARQAVLDGASYIGVGPTFVSGTKQFNEFAGLAYIQQVAIEISLPAFAIGGIDAANVSQVIAAGARRVAISGAICRAEQPLSVAAQFCEQLSR